MGDVYSDGKSSGPGAMTRVSIRCSVRCMGKIGLCLHKRAGSDVGVRAGLRFRITVRHGCN